MTEPEPPAPHLPQILPPEEVTAAGGEGAIDSDLAAKEQAWMDRALSGHTIQAAALKNDLYRAHIENVVADRNMRVQYAGRILRYLEVYSAGVGVLLVYHGFHLHGFRLETEIVAALVGSTAVAAIGLVGFIARGLFKSPPAPPAE